MKLIKAIINLVLLLWAGILPSAALICSAPENQVWEIFGTGYDYDAARSQAAMGYDTPIRSTSVYDEVPIRCTGDGTASLELKRRICCRRDNSSENGKRGLLQCSVRDETESLVVSRCVAASAPPRGKRSPPDGDGRRCAVRAIRATTWG